MKGLKYLADMASSKTDFKPIQLQGGQTRGRLVTQPQGPKPTNIPASKPESSEGFAYANRLKQDFENAVDHGEDAEEVRRRFQEQLGIKRQPRKDLMMAVEDATSVDTFEPSGKMATDDLNEVYNTYYKFHDAYDTGVAKKLLIHEFRDDILQQVDCNTVVIIKGPTGCGKTTQVPLFILDDARERGIYCNILVTQPRRIAATSVARRICDQRRWQLGTFVGYQIGLDKKVDPKDTRLTFVTAGVLLQKLVAQQLDEYTHIIVDEVHERESETDFILIILKKLVKMKRNRKKIILMSATMTTNKFAEYFRRKGQDGRFVVPPVIDLPEERPFDVEIRYLDYHQDILPVISQIHFDEDKPKIEGPMYRCAKIFLDLLKTVEHKEGYRGLGAVLVFLPGILEIENFSKLLRSGSNSFSEKWWICELHSQISFDEQMKVFGMPPTGMRKIILATNIAESSITVPDVKFVIDFCLTKRLFQDKDTSYSSLHLCWVSKSEAEQRAGRAGRTMDGRVYRLVPREFYAGFLEDSPPEMLRCPLDRLVLKAKELEMNDPPACILGLAMDPPNLSNIERTILNLKELGALTPKVRGEYTDQDGELTFTGKVMADLPLDTQLSKLITVGYMFSLLRECITMACIMSGKNVFSAPLDKKMETYSAKLGFGEGLKSDPITALRLYDVWKSLKARGSFHRSGGPTEKDWTNRNFAQLKILREVEKLEIEVTERLRRLGIVDSRIEIVKSNPGMIPLIMKVCLAGACYPNFFLHRRVDEEEAVRTLGKRDPCRTVYFKGFPQNQPGPLYRDEIKKLVACCGSGIRIQFDGSSKVYVEFQSSLIAHEDICNSKVENDVPVPGRVIKAVYRAVKMRHLDIPMKIPVLKNRNIALKVAKDIFGDQLLQVSRLSAISKDEDLVPLNRMPGLNRTWVPVTVTHVNDPSNFYVMLETTAKEYYLIQRQINPDYPDERVYVDLTPLEITPGQHCLAQYHDSSSPVQYYRAKIVAVQMQRDGGGDVKVHFIDFGNYEVVDVRTLKGYGPQLLEQKVDQELPIALRCRLAEIGPSSESQSQSDAEWSPKAIMDFKRLCNYRSFDAEIYSVVRDTMAVTLYPQCRNDGFKLPKEESINFLLVREGHAKFVEEPYMSKENHGFREDIVSRKNPDGYISSINDERHMMQLDNIEIDFQSLKNEYPVVDCELSGPWSPLEMSIYPITRKSRGKSARVEQNSINSVLINENPVDTTLRMILAGSVSQSQVTSGLVLRNTTVLPPRRGLSGILTMLFAPRIELRVDPNMTHFTGALCGLGCDENGVSLDYENDVEITFDCKFDLSDIEQINKLRFWMETVLCRKLGVTDHHSCSEEGMADVQKKCVGYLWELVKKDREPLSLTYFDDTYEWNQVPIEYLIPPSNSFAEVYQLIHGVRLRKPSAFEARRMLERHLMKMDMIITGHESMKEPIDCMFCQVQIENPRSLDFHAKTEYHKLRVKAALEMYVGVSKAQENE